MKYFIDSCSFFSMKDVYRPTVFPGAWRALEELLEGRKAMSCGEVFEEIEGDKEDPIFKLVDRFRKNFLEPTVKIQKEVKNLLSKYPNLIDPRNNKSSADPFLIATAKVNSGIVVTEEKLTGALDHPNIPDVCRDQGVKCIKIVGVFESENITFH